MLRNKESEAAYKKKKPTTKKKDINIKRGSISSTSNTACSSPGVATRETLKIRNIIRLKQTFCYSAAAEIPGYNSQKSFPPVKIVFKRKARWLNEMKAAPSQAGLFSKDPTSDQEAAGNSFSKWDLFHYPTAAFQLLQSISFITSFKKQNKTKKNPGFGSIQIWPVVLERLNPRGRWASSSSATGSAYSMMARYKAGSM